MNIAVTKTIIILVLSTLDGTSPFVLDSVRRCPVDSQCFCYADELSCEGRGLTTFPSFQPTTIPYGHFVVNMSSNPISTIPANAFVNLNASDSTAFYLYFQDCNISSIQTDAFLGIENRVSQLYLDNNELLTFPDELRKLTRIRELYMKNNPISTLSSSSATLASIGLSLRIFTVSLSFFKSWPVELSYLKSVINLGLADVPFTDIPLNAFSGLNNNLQFLSISGSLFVTVPEAICNLPNLDWLQVKESFQLSVDSIFDKCIRTMSSVSNLRLSSNNFDGIPNVFDKCPSLHSLDLNGNGLSRIHVKDVPPNTNLAVLYLNFNNFTSIPTALGKMAALGELFFEMNLVQSIGTLDLENFGNLRRLSLKGNPLHSISDGAFKYTPLLLDLDLSETRLTNLPASLSSLVHLWNLNLERNPTDCTCALAALKTWDVSYVKIYGNCGTNPISVMSYITIGLHSCP